MNAEGNILVWYGGNAPALWRKLLLWKREFSRRHPGSTIALLEGEEFSLPRFKELVASQGLFGSRLLLILRDLTEDDLVQLQAELAELPSSITLLFVWLRIPPPAPAALARLLPQAKIEEFRAPARHELSDWIRQEALRCRAKITPRVAELLAQLLGRDLLVRRKDKKSGRWVEENLWDLWQILREIEKLAAASDVITEELVQQLVKPVESQAIFEMMDALLAGKLREALAIAHGICGSWERASSKEVLMINDRLAAQVRDLLLVRAVLEEKGGGEGSTRLRELLPSGWKPEKVFVMVKKAKNLPLALLKAIHQTLSLADQQIKTGEREPIEALVTGFIGIATLVKGAKVS